MLFLLHLVLVPFLRDSMTDDWLKCSASMKFRVDEWLNSPEEPDAVFDVCAQGFCFRSTITMYCSIFSNPSSTDLPAVGQRLWMRSPAYAGCMNARTDWLDVGIIMRETR